ncbi:MAG TPA: hypothetical protein PLW50_00825 [Smithellaceae bacterium]|nr:hypothetical protein [Smithellaceae bacterium]
MAYLGYEFYYDGTRATWWGYLQVALVNMGWELHDDISATVKVYKSNGESGNEPYGYIWIDAGTGTYVQFCAYQHWDAVSHVGIRPRYTADSPSTHSRVSVFSSTYPAFLGGDKDMVVMVASQYYTGNVTGCCFGHIPTRQGFVVNAHGTAGTAGTLTVASTSGLGKGVNIQIVGTNGYCDRAFVISSPNSSTIIVNKLAVDYGTGSKIGTPASTFGITNGPSYYGYWYPVSVWGDSGTAGTSTLSYTLIVATPQFNSILFSENKYILSPYIISNVSSAVPGSLIGCTKHFLYGYMPTQLDVAIANNDGSISTAGTGSFGTASSAGTASLIDSSKAWGADELVGKFCVITGGSGTAAGGVKKITGNDATSFTADSNWKIQPVSGSVYMLSDFARRQMQNVIGSYSMYLITDTKVPE